MASDQDEIWAHNLWNHDPVLASAAVCTIQRSET